MVTIAADTTTGAGVIRSRQSSLTATTSTIILLATSFALAPDRAQAQWWTAAPADYEDCAERVEKSLLSGESKAAALSNCESKFAGRRKRGGGYAYYNGPVDRYDARDAYARRNNFVCQPGTWFRGEGGQRQLCQ